MISVLIVTFNNERHIGACLGSLPWRTAAFELWITDNGSRDRTRESAGNSLRRLRKSGVHELWNSADLGFHTFD